MIQRKNSRKSYVKQNPFINFKNSTTLFAVIHLDFKIITLMKNILNIEDLLSLDSNLAPIKQRTIMQMILFIIGIAAIFFGVQVELPDYLAYTLAVAGHTIAIIALGFLFSTPRDIINRKTKEILHKHKYYFCSKDEGNLLNDINNGNINRLPDYAGDTGQILAIIYTSPTNSYYVAQLFKFVPYEYQPHSAPIIYCKAKKMAHSLKYAT